MTQHVVTTCHGVTIGSLLSLATPNAVFWTVHAERILRSPLVTFGDILTLAVQLHHHSMFRYISATDDNLVLILRHFIILTIVVNPITPLITTCFFFPEFQYKGLNCPRNVCAPDIQVTEHFSTFRYPSWLPLIFSANRNKYRFLWFAAVECNMICLLEAIFADFKWKYGCFFTLIFT